MRHADPALTRWAAGSAAPRTALWVSIGLFVATLLVTRQTQVPGLDGLAAPWALLLVVACLRWRPALAALLPMSLFGAASVLASLLLGNDPANALRFFVITVGTLLAFHIRPVAVAPGIVLLPLALQAGLIAAVSIGLGVLHDDELAALVRAWVLETTWGDIYSFDGLYYRVQVIGNALLPLLFLVSLWRWRQSRFHRFMTLLALLGLVAAGNLTYLLMAGVAVLIRTWRFALRHMAARIFVALVACVAIALAWSTANDVLERKFDGTDSSMGVRFDQLEVAADLWRESPARFVFGAGLGANFPDGRERNYSEYQYIELQSLYLLVQLGLVGMALYLATLALGARRFLNAHGQCIFWLYMLSGITNPYILDTNQIIATLLLVCFFPRSAALPASRPRGADARIVAATP